MVIVVQHESEKQSPLFSVAQNQTDTPFAGKEQRSLAGYVKN
jgi:hypothetical protein